MLTRLCHHCHCSLLCSTLDLDSNSLSGTIPQQLENMVKLRYAVLFVSLVLLLLHTHT